MSWLVIKKEVKYHLAYYAHDTQGIENVNINIFRYEHEEDAKNKAYRLAGGDPKKKYKIKRKGKIVFKSNGNYDIKNSYSDIYISCENCPINTDYDSEGSIVINVDDDRI